VRFVGLCCVIVIWFVNARSKSAEPFKQTSVNTQNPLARHHYRNRNRDVTKLA